MATLVDAGLIRSIADIFELTYEQVLSLDRFAEVSARKLINAITAKKSVSLARLIYGLGIRHVGQQTAVDLANTFKNLDTFGTASYEDLRAVEGVGEIVAEAVLAWFLDDDNRAVLAKFKQLGVWPQAVKQTAGRLLGKSFAITGSLESMSREAAADKIRSLGGTFQSSVGKGTTYLVMGAKTGNTKADKARKLGTEVIDEEKFIDLIS